MEGCFHEIHYLKLPWEADKQADDMYASPIGKEIKQME